MYKEELQAKPDISNPDTDKFEYKLIWYNHYYPEELSMVMETDPNLNDADLSSQTFEEWTVPFTEDERVLRKLIVAASEEFRFDYSPWTDAILQHPHHRHRHRRRHLHRRHLL